jgi:alanyl aminopeptidase
MGHAMAEPALQEQHWQWLRDNFPAFVARIPEQWRRYTPALGSDFCSADRLAELQQLFELHGNLAPGHERRLAQAEEQIGLCLALRDRGQALVEAWPVQ